MTAQRIISVDDHVIERPDTFTSRLPASMRDDALQINRDGDGIDWWVYAGEPVRKVSTSAAACRPDRGPVATYDELPESAYDPAKRLEAMDADGVDVEVLFPQFAGFGGGPFMSSRGTDEMRLAHIRAYNDFVAEEWAAHSDRFVPQALAPLWDPKLAAAEVERAVGKGHRAVMWSSAPQAFGMLDFNDRGWDPLWSTCQDLGIPVALHIGSHGAVPEPWDGYGPFSRLAMVSVTAITSNIADITNLLFSGVPQRFPDLNFISVESGVGWVPYLLETADHQYDRQRLWNEGLELKPSEYFKRQVYVTFWFEHLTPLLCDAIGVDNIMWEADFPHPTSTYPESKRFIADSVKDLAEGDRAKVLCSNAETVFGISAA
ncbi:MAG: amidohydrolase [Actinobacteria bacterium ATB1]|nr:amidohydrolase [Actinobacteria bacterium ATB1]